MNKPKPFGRSLTGSRRRFLVEGTGVLGALALFALTPRARAAELPHVSPADPTAQALHYTEDAGKLDKAKAPTYIPGSNCATCNLFQGGTPFGPCALFPGKAVSEKGWCSGYVKKP